MLLRQYVLDLEQFKTDCRHLATGLFNGHFVQGLDRYPGVLAAVFYQYYPAPIREAADHSLHHLTGMGKFVVSIDKRTNFTLIRTHEMGSSIDDRLRGVNLTFTKPVDFDWLGEPTNYKLSQQWLVHIAARD